MRFKKAKTSPRISAPAKSGKPEHDAVFVPRDLLDNIARRLDIAVSSAVVCRLALNEQKADCDQDIAMVLWFITEELQRQIERIDRVTGSTSKTALRTKQSRRREVGSVKPANAKALRVPRSLLSDIRYRLGLIVGSTKVCGVALIMQHAERDIDVAAMLRDVVIDITRIQLQRIRAITNGTSEKPKRIARAVQ
jgi:hypothetical protein